MKSIFEKFNIKPNFRSNFKSSFKPQLGSLSTREFLMVVLLIIAVEGFLLYSYILKPTYLEYETKVDELVEKENVLDGLKAEYARKGEMEEEILRLEGQMEEIQRQVPQYLSQEEVVLFMEDLSENSGLPLKILAFSNAQFLPLVTMSSEDGKTTSVGSGEYQTPEPMFVEQLISVNYSGDYNQLYTFFRGIEESERKAAAKTMSVSVDDEGELSGVMNLSFVSYWDDNVGQKPYIMETIPIEGKNSPFEQYTGYSSTISGAPANQVGQKTITPDFYLKVNSYLNNSAKIFIYNCYNSGTESRYDANDVTRAKMTINGGDGTYTFNYTLGNYNINESNKTEIKDGKIRLEVLVQSRRSVDDKVGLILDITNNTDVPAEITVKGDDPGNPRFKMGSMTGNIVVK